ncbi:MAG: hypothetical protein QGH25_19560, partial [Candidatus Latescibacteria bacterium]|nr:hypothetical protein [Candidatus Latescibacterota bacterium]
TTWGLGAARVGLALRTTISVVSGISGANGPVQLKSVADRKSDMAAKNGFLFVIISLLPVSR